MGTYFVLQARCASSDALSSAEAALREIDSRMSTYKPDSELMVLNSAEPGATALVGAHLVRVLDMAERVRVQSGGAFNVSIGSLVSLWGFGPREPGPAPDADRIASVLPQGAGYVTLPPDRASRTGPLQIDLSSIAKGYGVDQAALALATRCADYMVDVGGEVRVRGVNRRGAPWRIGIEKPHADGTGGVETVLNLRDAAVATSGDYRNYREVDGERVSHTLDARTGRPIRHGLASVTVIHEQCALADAYATAINVLGPEQGFTLARRLNLAAYLIERSEDGFRTRYTDQMKPFLSANTKSTHTSTYTGGKH